MGHWILFDNAQSDWNEALPLGNGVFGGMAHYCGGQYHLVMNHYEVYYTYHHRYSHLFEAERAQPPPVSTEQYHNLVEQAKKNVWQDEDGGFLNYRRTIWPQADIPRQAGETSGVSAPPTGELDFTFAPELEAPEDFQLYLDIENAKTALRLEGEGCRLTAQTRVLQGHDAMVTRVAQSRPGLLRAVTLRYPQRRNHEGFTFAYARTGSDTIVCRVSFYPSGEDRAKYPPFAFVTAHKVLGAAFDLSVEGNEAVLQLREGGQSVTILSYVVTELSGAVDLAEQASRALCEVATGLDGCLAAHQAHWDAFFGRSAVHLPDAVLEKLWYLNLYVLGCASGRGGRRYEQASGLNGLWDMRQPSIWGSLWYWDVNIQASYWPVYTANHLELAEVFNEGFLSYMDAAERRAQSFYGMRGYAIDYPHTFYNCMWPWCAQHLWWYYEYSRDVDFLRDKAYPMFVGQIRFIQDVIQYDGAKDCYYFFPDLSPEQGPITRNATITVATVKYLLQMALEANRILGESQEDAKAFERLLDKLPPYPTAKLDRYGEVIVDSEWSPPNIALRHPSLLMPIFPMHEIGQGSELAENTVFFASENTEIGVFPFGWISAAAARLGKGNMALRILYEQGLDMILRANGMGAEETDRWINHCLLNRGNLYYPFMMECVGEVVNCVNEMLLQSQDGVIRVFPAAPDGTVEKRREKWQMLPVTQPWGEETPASWQDCGFERLLAKGGFEVSAMRQGGETRWVRIHSLHGGQVRLSLPNWPVRTAEGAPCEARYENGILSFDTEAGACYEIGDAPAAPPHAESRGVLTYTTYTGRTNFIGKDRNSDAIKLLDSFLYDAYIANDRVKSIIACYFNFGVPLDDIPENAQNATELKFIKVLPGLAYSSYLGYGFGHPAANVAADSGQGGYLLRDSVQGEVNACFCVELPKGRYDVLVVSGGDKAACTVASIGVHSTTLSTAAGEYRADVIPVVHKRDGVITIAVDGGQGLPWSLNLVVIRKVAAYL